MSLPLEDIQKRVETMGVSKAAVSLGISRQHLYDIINNKRGIGEKVLKALGIRKRFEYVDKRKRS